jgi:hypothetical protein
MKALAGVVPKSDLPMQITGVDVCLRRPDDAGQSRCAGKPSRLTDKNGKVKKKKAKVDKNAPRLRPPACWSPFASSSPFVRATNGRLRMSICRSPRSMPMAAPYGNTHQARRRDHFSPGASGQRSSEVFGQIDPQARPVSAQDWRQPWPVLADSGSVYYDVDVPDFAGEPLSMSGSDADVHAETPSTRLKMR